MNTKSAEYAPYEPPFDIKKIFERIDSELNDKKELYALFLVSGFVESYLRQLLYIKGGFSKGSLTKKTIEQIDRINFGTVLVLQLALNHIDYGLYKELIDFNKHRNKYAHELPTYNLDIERKRIIKIVKRGKIICQKVFDIYIKELDEEQKKII